MLASPALVLAIAAEAFAAVADCDASVALVSAVDANPDAAAADPAADFSLVTSSTRIDRRSMSISGRAPSAVTTPMRNCVIAGSGSAGNVFSMLTVSQSPVPASGRMPLVSYQAWLVKLGRNAFTNDLIQLPACAARAVTVIL